MLMALCDEETLSDVDLTEEFLSGYLSTTETKDSSRSNE